MKEMDLNPMLNEGSLKSHRVFVVGWPLRKLTNLPSLQTLLLEYLCKLELVS